MQYEGKIYGKVGGEYIELEPPKITLQPTQYLLCYADRDCYTIDFHHPSLIWYLCRNNREAMHRDTGAFWVTAPLSSPEYAFSTPEEAAECFYNFYPHLKPQQ